jgi:hypothetical protein
MALWNRHKPVQPAQSLEELFSPSVFNEWTQRWHNLLRDFAPGSRMSYGGYQYLIAAVFYVHNIDGVMFYRYILKHESGHVKWLEVPAESSSYYASVYSHVPCDEATLREHVNAALQMRASVEETVTYGSHTRGICRMVRLSSAPGGQPDLLAERFDDGPWVLYSKAVVRIDELAAVKN